MPGMRLPGVTWTLPSASADGLLGEAMSPVNWKVASMKL
jgi:hypothetical protein